MEINVIIIFHFVYFQALGDPATAANKTRTRAQKQPILVRLESSQLRDVQLGKHNGRGGGRSGVFGINGWVENDWTSIPPRLPRISQNLSTGHLQNLIFRDVGISWKVTLSQITSKMVSGDPRWSLDAPWVLLHDASWVLMMHIMSAHDASWVLFKGSMMLKYHACHQKIAFGNSSPDPANPLDQGEMRLGRQLATPLPSAGG